jgi:hypothetical protein
MNGAVLEPGTRQRISFSGVALQKQKTARGFFLGASQSGEGILTPATQ